MHLFELEPITRLRAQDKYVVLQYRGREYLPGDSLAGPDRPLAESESQSGQIWLVNTSAQQAWLSAQLKSLDTLA